VNGLEEELLQMNDRDVGREPVVCECDRGESRTEGKSDRCGEMFLCESVIEELVSRELRVD